MRILILTKYGRLAASSRQRFLQFIPELEQRGIRCDVSPLLSDAYLERRFRTGRVSLRHALTALFRRALVVAFAGRYDAVILYSEGYPYLPPILVRILAFRRIPYIYDFDDAVFHPYECHRVRLIRWILGGKIRRLIAGAACVFAGSRYLADYARALNPQVEVIPTVVDLARYSRRESEKSADEPLIVGWIGSPSTSQYVTLIEGALKRFCRSRPTRIVLVGSGPVSLEGLPVEIRPWSEETELEDLQSFDIGMMPLPDTGWTRGKCGFKLIQYMACSLPVIASPVGANLEIVEDGVHGLLASDEEEWVRALETLAADPDLRRRMGAAGRQRVEQNYSIAAVFSTIERRIRETCLIQEEGDRNIDWSVVESFGSEWSRFDHRDLPEEEIEEMFAYYFRIFPWHLLPEGAVGFDLGCGSGRWAKRVAPRVGELHCIEPSREALEVAKKNLAELPNCRFHLGGTEEIPLPDASADFGYSLGVLHHLPDTERGLRACVRKLKPGAPFLLYLYYALENRPLWYRWLWKASEPIRFLLSRSPRPIRYTVTQGIAALVYWPMARTARIFERIGFDVRHFPLAAYRSRSFYVMRNDALDRFGTRLEKRFERSEIQRMMEAAGLANIHFSPTSYWCAVGTRK